MSPELASGNVVITAEQFNPTIVSQIWLAKTGLVKEDEFAQGCIFADSVAQVRAREFELLVIPDRAQFVPTVEIERRQQVISEKLGLLVTRLPETPYRAMGFNLIWHVTPAQSSVEDFCRRLFLVPGSPVHYLFDVDDEYEYHDWGVIGFGVGDIPTPLQHLGVFRCTFRAEHVPFKRNFPHSEVRAYEDDEHIEMASKLDHDLHMRWRELLARRLRKFIAPKQAVEVRKEAPSVI